MKHGKRFNHLSRPAAHRKALLVNLAKALILHKRINTTLAKAKALKKFIEPILTKAKIDTTHARRIVFSHFQDKVPVKELFNEIAPKIMDRPGGYTRIIRLGNRLGDNAEMCMIELVDYNERFQSKNNSKKTKTRKPQTAVQQEASQVANPKQAVATEFEQATDKQVLEDRTAPQQGAEMTSQAHEKSMDATVDEHSSK